MDNAFNRQDSVQSPQETVTPLPPHEHFVVKQILHPVVVRILHEIKPLSPGYLVRDKAQPKEGVILKTKERKLSVKGPLICTDRTVSLNILKNPLLKRRKFNH